MIDRIATLLVLLVLFFNVACNSMPVCAEQQHELKRVEFLITGTECPVCLNRIRTKFEKTPGVSKVLVWLWHPHYAMVTYDPKQTDWDHIKQSISDEHVQLTDLKESESK